jgi:uncharacterized membrane protein YfcA
MVTREITLPRLGLIAGTRAALGAGAGLLLADRLSPDQRRAVGWTLLAVGVVTTFPLAADFLFGDRGARSNGPVRRAPEREPEVAAPR